jgi:hypothetical protein
MKKNTTKYTHLVVNLDFTPTLGLWIGPVERKPYMATSGPVINGSLKPKGPRTKRRSKLKEREAPTSRRRSRGIKSHTDV